ncbi:MAG: hypothetical protein ACXVP4_12695, partial [Bacteroidia bacterium]
FIPILLGIIIYNIFFSKAAIIKRKLRKTVGKKISDFQTGEVAKTVGAIKYVGDTLNAPLSARKCAYYHVLVEERVSSGKSSYWKTIIEEETAAHVVITEGRDYALIETQMVKTYLIDDKQYSSGFLNDATDTLKLYLDRHGYDAVNWLGMNNSIRYKEGILEEGELVAVAGKGTWKKKEEVKLDIPVERILVIGPDNLEPVYFSDDTDVAKKEEENQIV